LFESGRDRCLQPLPNTIVHYVDGPNSEAR
jgi:hypothetical protein